MTAEQSTKSGDLLNIRPCDCTGNTPMKLACLETLGHGAGGPLSLSPADLGSPGEPLVQPSGALAEWSALELHAGNSG